MGWAGHQDDQSGFRMQISGLSLDVRCSRARQGPGSCASYRLSTDSPSQTVGLGSSGQLRSLPGNPDAFPASGLGFCPGGFVRGCYSSSMGTTRNKIHFKNTLLVIPFGLFFFFWK